VGWGYTLTNTADFLVVTGASFTPSSLYGSFQDYISAFNFIVVGPSPESPSVSQAFNPGTHGGVGAFTVSSTAPSGIAITGNIVLNYSLFSQDPNAPNFDPGASLLVADATISAPAVVNIVPEPATFLLIAGPLLLAVALRRAKITGFEAT
jgi:hypothetical protein